MVRNFTDKITTSSIHFSLSSCDFTLENIDLIWRYFQQPPNFKIYNAINVDNTLHLVFVVTHHRNEYDLLST